jgi:hypothetical protein
MTFVTGAENRFLTGFRRFGMTNLGGQVGLERLYIADDKGPAVNAHDPFRLQTRQIARDEFANGSDLCGQFLVVCGQRNFDPLGDLLAFALSHAKQVRSETLPNCCKR